MTATKMLTPAELARAAKAASRAAAAEQKAADEAAARAAGNLPEGVYASDKEFGEALGKHIAEGVKLAENIRASLEFHKLIDEAAPLPTWPELEKGLRLAHQMGTCPYTREGIFLHLVKRYETRIKSEAGATWENHSGRLLRSGVKTAVDLLAMKGAAWKTYCTQYPQAATLRQGMQTAANNEWKRLMKLDPHTPTPTKEKAPDVIKTLPEQFAGVKLEGLSVKLEKVEEDGYDIPPKIREAMITLIGWLPVKSVK